MESSVIVTLEKTVDSLKITIPPPALEVGPPSLPPSPPGGVDLEAQTTISPSPPRRGAVGLRRANQTSRQPESLWSLV